MCYRLSYNIPHHFKYYRKTLSIIVIAVLTVDHLRADDAQLSTISQNMCCINVAIDILTNAHKICNRIVISRINDSDNGQIISIASPHSSSTINQQPIGAAAPPADATRSQGTRQRKSAKGEQGENAFIFLHHLNGTHRQDLEAEITFHTFILAFVVVVVGIVATRDFLWLVRSYHSPQPRSPEITITTANLSTALHCRWSTGLVVHYISM